MTMEETLLTIWKQAMLDDAKSVDVEGKKFPVKKISQHRLRQVDFVFAGQELRGLEQNPETKSRWAQLARDGKKVMQFLSGRSYVAVVFDGKVKVYGDTRRPGSRSTNV